MPQPIRSISDLENHDGLFDSPYQQNETLSDIQLLLMNGVGSNNTINREAAKENYSENILKSLEKIYSNVDEISMAAANVSNPYRQAKNETLYRVPDDISDNELLGLKAKGLVQGYGRSVNLTYKGSSVLRERWLNSENEFEKNKTKSKFDIRSANINGKKKFKKIAELGE